MFYSTVLKSRLKRYFNKIGESIGLPVALVDASNKVILNNDLFDENMLKAIKDENNFYKKTIACEEMEYHLVVKALDSEKDIAKFDKVIELIAENILFFLQQEREAQGLAQEMLEKYEELNLLYDMIAELSTIFDETEICRITLARAMKVLNVESGAIVLRDPETDTLRLTYGKCREGIQKSRDPAMLLELARRTIELRKEILYDDKSLLPDNIFAGFENKNLCSILSVPINSSDNIVGVIILVGKINGDVFNSGDIKLLFAIAGYAGITISSNRMIEQMRVAEALQHEMKLARNIQQSLLPEKTPEIANLQISGVCIPATAVGGDFFQFTHLNGSSWQITVADVSGHGIGAALTMASLRSILRSESRDMLETNKVIANTNKFMCDDTKDTGMYATLFLAVYDEKSRKLQYSNAGHQVPFLWRSEEEKVLLLKKGGMPVGMFSDERYEQEQIRLNRDDILVIYTDGLTEAKNERGEFYTEDRLLKLVEKNKQDSAQELLEEILDSVTTFQNGEHQRDDITIVVLKAT